MPSPGSGITVRDQRDAAGLRGAALVARRDDEGVTEFGNVIAFVRPRRAGAMPALPLPAIAPDERPAPHVAKVSIGTGIAFFATSLVLHIMPLALLWHQPRPMASIGVEVMTIEITLGATTPAGLAPTPGEQEAQPAAPSEQPAEDERVTEQQPRAATTMPQELPVAAQETAPEVKPQEAAPATQTVESNAQEQTPETAVAETTATTRPAQQTEQPRPQVQAVQQAPERQRIDAPTEKKAAEQKHTAAAPAADTARGVGIGRSDRTATYEGMVAAHVKRYMQAPAAVRRAASARGVSSEFPVTLEYAIDGAGRVTSTKVLVSSGDQAVDRAVIAVVQKASPVPRPPDGRPRIFSQRLTFNERLIRR